MSDDELSYLSPGFDLAVLTVPRLRSILVSHDVSYPSSAKKSQLIQLVNDEILPKSKRILSARARTKRTSKGITDMPSSQEDTVNGYEDEELMPPPPVPKTPRGRKSRTTTVGLNASEDEIPTATSATSRRTPGRKSTTKHPRASDTETDTHTDTRVPAARKSRKSEAPITPSVKIEEPNLPVKRERRSDESPFTDDNPFQSGSSPPSGDRRVSTESRRKSIGTENKRRKSTSRKRQTTSPSDVASKQEDGFVPPSSSTFHVPITRLGRSPVKVEEPGEDGIPITEEFTPEEQVDWVRQQEADGRSGQEIVPARRRKVRKSSAVGRSAPWIVIFTLLTAFGGWWRKEKIEIGYCGVGKPSWSLTETKVPDWADVLQPQCEPCPQHAYCEPNFEAKCEQDFIIKPHPLSLGGVLPLPPSCEPDGEKVRKIKVVADRAVEELRERRAKHECGDLVDERGKLEPVEIREPELKKEVSKMRRKGMSDVEFDDLWRGALGEIMDRDEIVSETSGSPGALHPVLLSSTSLARLSFTCAIRRSTRVTLARYRFHLFTLIATIAAALYGRSRLLARKAATARVPALVAMTLDRLATQAALYSQSSAPEAWISIGQLRDDVLRAELRFSDRERAWKGVREVVEGNTNVRTNVREGRHGEVSKVWEWIGPVGALEDGGRESGKVRFLDSPAADSDAATPPTGKEIAESRKWDEGRPIY